jgi:hypothetical protein
MAICNRDLDVSQQRQEYQATIAPTATGLTYLLAVVPYPARLVAMAQGAVGLSGAPNHSIWLNRFVVGSGITTISFGNSLVTTAMGTSGIQSFSLPLASTFPLQAGDVLLLSTAASNTSAASVCVTTVIQALQDYKTEFGV